MRALVWSLVNFCLVLVIPASLPDISSGTQVFDSLLDVALFLMYSLFISCYLFLSFFLVTYFPSCFTNEITDTGTTRRLVIFYENDLVIMVAFIHFLMTLSKTNK